MSAPATSSSSMSRSCARSARTKFTDPVPAPEHHRVQHFRQEARGSTCCSRTVSTPAPRFYIGYDDHYRQGDMIFDDLNGDGYTARAGVSRGHRPAADEPRVLHEVPVPLPVLRVHVMTIRTLTILTTVLALGVGFLVAAQEEGASGPQLDRLTLPPRDSPSRSTPPTSRTRGRWRSARTARCSSARAGRGTSMPCSTTTAISPRTAC